LRLVLAGHGEPAYVAHLQAEATRLGVASALVWPGFLAGEEKWAALAAADGFVLPSYSENFGMAVVEAMAVGCPVVISDHVGIHADVTTAHAGIVTTCDSQELSRALTVLANNADLRTRMGNNARILVGERFSLEAVTNSLLRLYSNIRTDGAVALSL
jgi:glycosyltransferase involved in cell wall biosynthesis